MVKASFLVAIVLAASSAFAQPGRGAPGRPPPPPAAAFDATGWTLLGEQEVKGKRDRDTINVGKYEGKFDQIQIVVLNSDVEIKDLTITFGNAEKWSPGLKHFFKEGQRSRAIDLPGKDRYIAKIEMLYANTPGGGAAKVAVYARDKAARVGGGGGGWRFDSRGWTLLGSQEVKGRRDRDTINVGKYEGKFDELSIAVLDSDIELKDFTVHFANGEKWSPGLKHAFKEGQRSRAIDLPGNNRTIVKIEMLYANTPGGGAAKVEVYGRNKKGGGPPVPPAPPVFTWDNKGWTMLGEQSVDGRRDKDRIRVGKYAGKFDQLTMVVLDSDIELRDLQIHFGNRQMWAPAVKHVFKEGSRTRVIDLPGKDRTIQRIDLSYANLLGGGKARVQVWGRDAGRPPPPPIAPITWDNKGWTLIAKSTVDGWRDRDRLDTPGGRPFSEVMFVVSGSDVQLNNITITFGNGEKFQMPSSVVFKEGTRTAPIDVPGKLRKIKSVELAYANLPGGGRASLEIWGRVKPGAPPVAQPVPPPPPVPTPGTPPPTVRPAQPPPPPPVVRDHRR